MAEGERAVADQQHMRRVFHDRARRQHRVLRSADPGDGPGTAVAPLHDGSIHLLRAGGGEDGAAPGIEQRIVLERDNGNRHCVERAAITSEDVAPGGERAP